MNQMPPDVPDDTKTVRDYVAILRRRKPALILPAVAIFLSALIVAVVIPRTYRSTSTVLIEEQEIPKDFVISTVTGFAEQRLQAINQRIMSTSKLLDIITRFNLYSDRKSKETMEEIVERMRGDIRFATISADVADRTTGRQGPMTIAFTVSYDGKQPQVVQQVANILASLYLEENLKTREQRTAGASRFLEEEAKTLQQNLSDVDGKIAAFKAKNINALPELLQVNFQALDRIERDLEQLKDQLRSLKEKEGYLETQLASVPTETADQDRTLLKELRAKLVQLQTRYSDKYPDVLRTKMDIAKLEKRVASGEGETQPKRTLTAVTDQVNNPSYVTLASQLAGVQTDIESVKRQIADTQKKRDDYLARNAASPRVEETYKALMVERNNTQAKYDELMKRVMEARVAQGLEKEQMGERFTLIDPARLPEKPVKPNVPAILLIGLFLGVGSGVGLVAVREFSDESVRTALQLAHAIPYPVVGTIPYIVTESEKARARRRRAAGLMWSAVGIIAVVVLFHFFVMDLDILWAKLSRRM